MNSKIKIGFGGCFLVGFLMLCCVGGILLGSFSLIRSSDVYKLALETVQESPRAQDVLGRPIEAEWLVTQFSVNQTNGEGDASLQLPVKGPNGSGVVYFEAVLVDNEWVTASAELEVDGERFSLGR